jgi:Nif-specific regulatory protein
MTIIESSGRSSDLTTMQGGTEQPETKTPKRTSSLREILEGVERDILLNALRESHGNKAKAARTLGITERLMGIRVKSLGIDWRSLRRKRS